jgi:hypothetical protein
VVASPCLIIPRETSRQEVCYFRCWHTADLAGLLLLFVCVCVCVHASACLLQAHARSSQTHKDCIVSRPLTSPFAQHTSLILPVFTNWPFSRSSSPDIRVFVCHILRNSSLSAKHNTASWERVHGKAQHNTRRYAFITLNINQAHGGLLSGN